VKAQYVKITQTGSSDANWWSIDELDIKETDLPAIELDAVLTADNAGRILNAGDQVKVTVSATDAEKLFAGKLLVNYDSSKFTYVSSSINQQFGKEGETAFMVAKVEDGKLSYALTSLGDAPGKDGNVGLIDIIFTVNADGAASLSKASEYADVNGTLVMLNADRGISIALSNADVNGDNKINSGDLVDVAKAFGKATFNPKFDVNHDGKINIEDIAFVARKLLEM
jgi:protein involved in polysaccharide export with SLBB domain